MTTMTAGQRISLLSSWINPSSTNEKAQQDRAERMIADAIRGGFRGSAQQHV